jgi:hypothetical protein
MARGAFKRPGKGKEKGKEEGQQENDEKEKEKQEDGGGEVKRWLTEVVQAVGGHKAMQDAWEKERFKPMRTNYEKLFSAEPWSRMVVLGQEQGGEKEEGGGGNGGGKGKGKE